MSIPVDKRLGPYDQDFEAYTKACFGQAAKVIHPKFTSYHYQCPRCGHTGSRDFDVVVMLAQCRECGYPVRLEAV